MGKHQKLGIPGELQRIAKQFAETVVRLESEKYDLSYTVRRTNT